MRKRLLLVAILAATFLDPIAVANSQSSVPETIGFRTPSNNIHCLIEDWSTAGKSSIYLRCDVMDILSAVPPKPKDCDGDWGQVFSITPNGPVGQRMCYTDSAFGETSKVLQYGAVWRQSGFVCKSEQDGLTCVNVLGHGFFLSRRQQRVF